MKRYAFFVEGLTEQIFLEKLLVEIFNLNTIVIDTKKIRGGSKNPISITQIGTTNVSNDNAYYILIYDCGGDSSIRSYIEDQRNNLLNSGYIKIFGIRDVYPDFIRSEIHNLEFGLYFGLPQRDLPTKFILSVMEIEAWFLAEEKHYTQIDSRLTSEFIKNNYPFDPANDNAELRDEPATDLNNIYQLVGKRYKKEKLLIERTLNSLDYDNIYLTVCRRTNQLNKLIKEINLFFS